MYPAINDKNLTCNAFGATELHDLISNILNSGAVLVSGGQLILSGYISTDQSRPLYAFEPTLLRKLSKTASGRKQTLERKLTAQAVTQHDRAGHKIANLLMYFLDQKVMQTRCNDGAVETRWTPLCEISQKLGDIFWSHSRRST